MRSRALGARATSSRPSATAARESIVNDAPSSTTMSATLPRASAPAMACPGADRTETRHVAQTGTRADQSTEALAERRRGYLREAPRFVPVRRTAYGPPGHRVGSAAESPDSRTLNLATFQHKQAGNVVGRHLTQPVP